MPFTSFNTFLYSSCNDFGTFPILEKELIRIGIENKTWMQYSKSKLLLGFPAVEAMMSN